MASPASRYTISPTVTSALGTSIIIPFLNTLADGEDIFLSESSELSALRV
jgi:hypothetical protein